MKQCICDQLTDIVEGESIKNFQDKIAYKEIAFYPTQWVTLYKCECCHTFWKEAYKATGHGEVPFLMKITLPPYATTEDLRKSMVIIREILANKAITINEEHCQAIALEVMGISYAKAGDYSSETIKSFAEGYLKTVEI